MRSIRLHRYMAAGLVLWTLVLAVLLIKDALELRRTIIGLATAEAKVHLTQDEAFRRWVSTRGGIYVPVSDDSPPNPFLQGVPERDIQTPSGKQLTLMNAAYIGRQVGSYYSRIHGVRTRITSLDHFRPETAPDAWERDALQAFENGRTEVLELTHSGGEPCLRLMRPIRTEPQCLKCHAVRGGAVGEQRGGASVTVPMRTYLDSWRTQLHRAFISFAVLWGLGVAGIALFARHFSRRLREQGSAEARLRVSQENYRVLVENSLTGICVVQEGRIVFANLEFARIHGYSLGEIIGMDPLNLVHPEDRPLAAERMRRRQQGESPSGQIQVRCLTRRGEVIWVQARTAWTSYDGSPAVLANVIDVTSTMLADAEREAAERQLQRLADGLIEVREMERQQFATEIHENIAQSLSAIKLRVESVLQDIDENSLFCEPLRPIVTDVQETVSEIRKTAQRYRPLGLDHLGLVRTLEWLCRQTARISPTLRITQSLRLKEEEIPDALKIIIFRIAEQVLHGLSGHREAFVHISLERIERRIFLVVTTNVSPAELSNAPPHSFLGTDLTIVALKRHVEAYGGTFALTTEAGRQTRLSASWEYYCSYPAQACAHGACRPLAGAHVAAAASPNLPGAGRGRGGGSAPGSWPCESFAPGGPSSRRLPPP